jgi:hypothetical protein
MTDPGRILNLKGHVYEIGEFVALQNIILIFLKCDSLMITVLFLRRFLHKYFQLYPFVSVTV